MLKFLDFKFYKENYLAIIMLVLSVVFIKIFNLEHIMENTSLENLQLIGLGLAFFYSLKAQNNKIFFNVLALVLFLMFLRELSYGRVFYGRIPNGGVEDIYPLSHFKYGYLTNVFIGLYIAFGALYAIIKKVWVDIINIIKNVKFPFWTFIMAITCVVGQIVSEATLHSTCIEETCELVLYFSILSLVLVYRKQLEK